MSNTLLLVFSTDIFFRFVYILGLIQAIFSVAMISLTARRLHDINSSFGRYLLGAIFVAIMIVGLWFFSLPLPYLGFALLTTSFGVIGIGNILILAPYLLFAFVLTEIALTFPYIATPIYFISENILTELQAHELVFIGIISGMYTLYYLYKLMLKGTAGENKYGKDPLDWIKRIKIYDEA